jgi:hypothetical protein
VAIDNKYGQVSFEEENTIGKDEPVVVFRAADPLLGKVLGAYLTAAYEAGAPKRHTDLILNTQGKVDDWQRENPELVREVPTSSNWDGKLRIV